MKVIFIVLVLLAACVSQIESVYTRLIYDNADCSGFHVAYFYDNSDSSELTCANGSGCQVLYSGKFWMKEICGTKVNPLSNEGFSVVSANLGQTCGQDYGEVGAVADRCIVRSVSPSLDVMKMSSCPGNEMTFTTYNDVNCSKPLGTTTYPKTCTFFSVLQRSFQTTNCPLPSYGSNPVASSAPTGPVPTSTTPSSSSAPSGSLAPTRSDSPTSLIGSSSVKLWVSDMLLVCSSAILWLL